MAKDNLVQRLITFLKKPETLEYNNRQAPVHNSYDDYENQQLQTASVAHTATADDYSAAYDTGYEPVLGGNRHSPHHASRLDALLMRAVQQFNAHQGYVIRYDDGRMRYCTGRDGQGRYVPYTEVDPDRRAVFLALDSGESQLFVHTLSDNTPVAVLCGPLWVENQVVGVLYLDNPARSRLHRGIFDVFCEQAARMLGEGLA